MKDTRRSRAEVGSADRPTATVRDDQSSSGRVRVDGRHLSLEGRPFRVRGVTYGTFLLRHDGQPYPEIIRVISDFEAMAAAGLNTVRTYTVPPLDVLEAAEAAGLRVLAGLHYPDWRDEPEPHRAAQRRILKAGRRAVDEAMGRLAGRPSVLAVSIGNEVPGDLVRVHGIGRVEDALSSLAAEVHQADPAMLVSYANFPTTEYLEIEGLDLCTFNVFLERPGPLQAYLRHLMIASGGRPLVITELGLAVAQHGEEAQASSLDWQLRLVDEAGCAGATVFSWTDDWAVAGQPVEGWGFGLTDRERRGRLSLETVSRWARRSVADLRSSWPRISVIVCAFNEERVIAECLASLERLDYPNLEVIVCDDGSTDGTRDVAGQFPFRVLALPHAGLSVARNAGLAAATGEIVAYLDADAWCHPEWPYHVALSIEHPNVAATGGPNLPVPQAGLVERAVALAPGGPSPVLITDDRAEHVPGCNMAFLRDDLRAIGGFDPIFTSAGDDVDVCWKLLDHRREIAFAPAAEVRHHRRASARAFLRQQRGYGRAERLVSGRHRHRFNRLGQARWSGFIYGGQPSVPRLLRPVVYHGPIGSAPYQPVVRRRSEALFGWLGAMLPLAVPVATAGLLLTLVSRWWLLAPAACLLLLVAYGAASAIGARPEPGEPRPASLRALVGYLSVVQPIVRAWGRVGTRPADPGPDPPSEWTGDRDEWVRGLARALAGRRCRIRMGGPGDAWDLEASIGPLLAGRVATGVAWRWLPRHRVRFRPRRWLAVLLLAGGAAIWGWGAAGAAVLAASMMALLIEAMVLRRQMRLALDRATSGAAR